MPHPVLVVEDDSPTRQALTGWLIEEGYSAKGVATGEAALRALQGSTWSAVLCDVNLGKGMDGIEVLRQARAASPDLVVLILTGYGSVSSAVEAMRLGANDYFTKPVDLDRLAHALERELARASLAAENKLLKQHLRDRFSSGNIVGRSRVLMALLENLERFAASDSTVLVTGESGVGKELFVNALHRYSPRADQPMVRVNCPALAEGVLESELFGHERGAFTGATKERRGRFETANGGTLFLDEIGEVSASVQAKLLRALEHRTIERVGSSQSLELDVRVVAATNRVLEEAVSRGLFRADLFYRLTVLRIQIPPLRERLDDIPLLAEHFLAEFNARTGRGIGGLSPRALKALQAHPWPGNVRELRNCLERAHLLCRGDIIDVADLPTLSTEGVTRKIEIEVGTPLVDAERRLMLATLDACAGNKAQAARILGIGLRTLFRRLEELESPMGSEVPPE